MVCNIMSRFLPLCVYTYNYGEIQCIVFEKECLMAAIIKRCIYCISNCFLLQQCDHGQNFKIPRDLGTPPPPSLAMNVTQGLTTTRARTRLNNIHVMEYIAATCKLNAAGVTHSLFRMNINIQYQAGSPLYKNF